MVLQCVAPGTYQQQAHSCKTDLAKEQCVAVCCSVLQCVAMDCNVLQCVAVYCSVLQCVAAGTYHK